MIGNFLLMGNHCQTKYPILFFIQSKTRMYAVRQHIITLIDSIIVLKMGRCSPLLLILPSKAT